LQIVLPHEQQQAPSFKKDGAWKDEKEYHTTKELPNF
jgi:hypothetical protein